jgi:MFS transporter, DHA1 family, tetracycline resistance protein
MSPTSLKPAFAFIFTVVLLDVISIGIVIPVLPKLIEEFAGSTAHAAEINGLFAMAWALMQLLFSPVLGALSDRFGRRPVILISCFGLAVDFFLVALAPSLAWLFVARLLGGITMANMSTANAYIADVTPPQERAAKFGMLGAAFGIGFVLGPLIGGVFGANDPRLPFWIAGGIALLNAAYGLFVLPESLPLEKRSAFKVKNANPLGALKLLNSTPVLKRLSMVNTLYFLAHHVLPTTFVLHAGYRFGWDAKMVGYTLAAVGVASIIVQAGLVGRIVQAIGERRALLAGLASGAIALAIYGLAPTGAWFFVGIPFGALMGLFGPAAQALMTREVAEAEQGKLQGANASVMGLAGLVGPIVFSLVFAWAIGAGASFKLPGAAYLLASGLLLLAFALMWSSKLRRVMMSSGLDAR